MDVTMDVHVNVRKFAQQPESSMAFQFHKFHTESVDFRMGPVEVSQLTPDISVTPPH